MVLCYKKRPIEVGIYEVISLNPYTEKEEKSKKDWRQYKDHRGWAGHYSERIIKWKKFST